MSSKSDRLTELIARIVIEISKYNVPRLGIVSQIKDPEGKGRILVYIPSFNWMTDDVGAWCFPIDKKSIIIPDVGDYVIVQFVDGNMDYPIYTGIDQRMKDMIPNSYIDENNQILFENRNKDFSIKYDENGEVLTVGDGSESFVKGDTTKTELQKNIDALTQLQTDFTTWVPVPNDGGLALKNLITAGFLTKTLASLINMLSNKIKGE